jgi:hypothetical protein
MRNVSNDFCGTLKSALAVAILAVVLPAVVRAADSCPLTHKVAAGDTLRELADFYFGDRHFDSAILLATNSRGRDGFSFISDINNISKIEKVCVPGMTEAQRLRSRYDTYVRAIFEMALPEPWETVKDLVDFPADSEITVATWMREAQLKALQDASGKWLAAAPYDLWVTVEPNLQQFCAAYASAHTGNRDQLILRLEQRLGLPPASNKSKFVRIRLAHPGQDVIFRPCMYPVTESTKCPLGPPPSDIEESHKNWLYQQYYSSYGQARLSSFPWTSLGYTFDWAPAPHSDTDFQKFGESEFVIRKGAPIAIVRAMDTVDYCQ